MDHLDKLENQSIYILREAYKKFKKLAMLWSIGKDSNVLLWLARKAFYGHVPIPLVHIDTSYKIPEMIEFRDKYAKEWNLKLIVGQKLAMVINLAKSSNGDGSGKDDAISTVTGLLTPIFGNLTSVVYTLKVKG